MKQKPPHILLVDNYDSFTYNLYDYLCQLGASCSVIRNDEYPIEAIQKMTFDGLVLSPGPKKPQEAGLLMQIIETFHLKKSILGICLGHQGIAEFFGAKLTKAKLPMHGKTSLITHTGHALFRNIPHTHQVMRYHSLIIDEMENTDLEIIATTPTGEIMAMVHNKLPLYGVQYHPESILTEYGLELLKNWLSTVCP